MPVLRVRSSRVGLLTRTACAFALLLSGLAVVGLGAAPAYAAAAISVSKSADAQVLAGGTVHFTLTASNPGTALEYNVSFRDQLPPGVTYVPGSTTPADVGNPQVATVGDHQVLTWPDVADMRPTTEVTLSFDATVDPTLYPVGSTFPNSASAYASTGPAAGAGLLGRQPHGRHLHRVRDLQHDHDQGVGARAAEDRVRGARGRADARRAPAPGGLHAHADQHDRGADPGGDPAGLHPCGHGVPGLRCGRQLDRSAGVHRRGAADPGARRRGELPDPHQRRHGHGPERPVGRLHPGDVGRRLPRCRARPSRRGTPPASRSRPTP